MKERKKLKEIYSQHRNAIENVILIALFISGYLIAWNFVKPMNDSQFELCEQVARDVYAQNENVLSEEFEPEVPEDFPVNITESEIKVGSTKDLHMGMVIARLQNGELVMTRDKQTEIAVILSILNGLLFIAVENLIDSIAYEIHQKIKK